MELSNKLKTEDESKHPLILRAMKNIGDKYPQQIRPRLSTIMHVSGRAHSRSVRESISDLDLGNYAANIKNT